MQHIEDDVETYLRRSFVTPFWIALNLDRSYELGGEAPIHFLDKLRESEQIPKEITDIPSLVEFLDDIMGGDGFFYQHVPLEQLLLVDGLSPKYHVDDLDDVYAEYEDLPKRESI